MSKTVREEFMSAFKEEMEVAERLERVQKALEGAVEDMDLMGRLLDELDKLQNRAQEYDLSMAQEIKFPSFFLGDIESMPFIEALQQLSFSVAKGKKTFVYPCKPDSGTRCCRRARFFPSMKTKPTQQCAGAKSIRLDSSSISMSLCKG